MLLDKHNREHNYLRISLTERCNLRCVYCMPAEGVALNPKEKLMQQDEIIRFAEEFVKLGVKKIRLTGGEPLVRKDAAEIMLRLSRLPVELTMTTNALLVDRYINTFKEAGIQSLNVSLDTLKAERFEQLTRRKDFQKTVDHIHLLINEGFKVKVNVVVMKNTNEDELVNFVEWTKDVPVHVRFIEFMPFDGNEWRWEKIVPYKEMMELIRRSYEVEKLKDAQNATTKAWQVPGHKGTFAVISSMTDHFCGSCNRLRLTADGKMRNCLFSKTETDLLTPLRNGELIEPLIRNCLEQKHFKHSGIEELQNLREDDFTDRSMILIGG